MQLVGDSHSQPGYVGIIGCTDGFEKTFYLELKIEIVVHPIPEILNPCCYDVLMQL